MLFCIVSEMGQLASKPITLNAHKLLLFTFAFFASTFLYAQTDSVKQFIDSALTLMQHHSMYAKKVDWTAVRDSTYKRAATARTYTETAPALHYAFNQLGDKHGWLVIADSEYRNAALQPSQRRSSKNMAEAASKGPHIYCGVVAGTYAYLSMPFFGGQDTASMNAFAQRLQDSLCRVITPKTRGVILDLRLNGGGNSYPMILGVSNLYGPVPQKRTGRGFYNNWAIKKGTLQITDSITISLRRTCGDASKLPLVVLVGPGTGSSGEFLAIGFVTRPRTVLVGEKTAGYTTANAGYWLPGVNNALVLADGTAEDATGKTYPDGIEPNITVSGDDFFNREKDPKIQAALAWLQKQQRSQR